MSRKALRTLFQLAVAICVCLCPVVLRADVTATILGNARDTTGAALAHAKITVTNVDTNLSRTTVTDATGEYRFLSLPAGTYTVEAELNGFQRFVAGNIVLSVDQQRRVDIPMQVGSLQQRVEVNAAAVQVETTNTQLGTVIDEKNIVNLPLNGRSYIDLLSIQAGVAPSRRGRRTDLRERAAPGIEFVPGKWRRRKRGAENDGGGRAESGFGGRIPTDHQFVRRRVRPLQRRRDERHHENGNQWAPRRGLRISAQQQYGCARFLRPRGYGAQAQPVRLRRGRTRAQEQAVLVHRLSGHTRAARHFGQSEPIAERRPAQRRLHSRRPEWRSERSVLGASADQASGLRRHRQRALQHSHLRKHGGVRLPGRSDSRQRDLADFGQSAQELHPGS